QSTSVAKNNYRPTRLLSLGNGSYSENIIASVTATDSKPLCQSLKTVIAAVKFEPTPLDSQFAGRTNSPTLSLAESYWQQSQFHLDVARTAARRATELAPNFAFAWAQLAELEFGLGRTKQALRLLDK